MSEYRRWRQAQGQDLEEVASSSEPPVRRSDPVENMRMYIMVHGGVDRHERLLDVDWLASLRAAATDVANGQTAAIDVLRSVLKRGNGH